jgi:hydrogenase/urease accessory protein HupE
MHFDCPDTYRALSLEDRLAATSDPGHENFVEVSVAGRRWTEILTPARATLVIPVDAISAKSGQPIAARLPVARTLAPDLSSFLALGVEHILFGLDHVLFILALFLVCRGARSLLTIVSAFTLGHSITLALSALGYYSLLPKVAESIIALSVVYLGVENLVALRRSGRRVDSANEPDAPRHRWLIALLFGLIHGFGFSYVLRDVGLPEDAMLGSLVGFNVGVEIGQVLILSALVPLVALLGRRFSYVRVATVLSALIAIVGSWWLIERTLL